MPRDNFTRKVQNMLSKRVATYCSNPNCHKLTFGPSVAKDAFVNIGVAAHITAAAPGGPRYDATMSPAQRSAIENGIWLCQNCAKLVDNDPSRYTVNLLNEWKHSAEETARFAVESWKSQPTAEESAELRTHRRQQIAAWRKAVEAERYDFVDYRSMFLSSAAYASLRPHLLPEVVKKIEAPRTLYVGGARGGNVRQYMLLDEITRIEREWRLI